MLKLNENQIYIGYYSIKDIPYFLFFKKSQDKDFVINVITNEKFLIKDLNTIGYDIEIGLYKYIKNNFKKYKNLDIFKQKDWESYEKELKYIKVLRFFDLDDSDIIFSKKTCDQIVLNKVIDKIRRYIKRYLSDELVSVYIEQLKKYDKLIDIFTLLPKECVETNIPFWCMELKNNTRGEFMIRCFEYNDFYYHNLIGIKLNDFNSSVDVSKKLNSFVEEIDSLEKKLCDIEKQDTINFINKYQNIILEKINEAKKTLNEELKNVDKNNKDDEILMEIQIIFEELDNVESNIENYDYENDPFEWWPQIIYPVVLLQKEISNEIKQVYDRLETLYKYDMRMPFLI